MQSWWLLLVCLFFVVLACENNQDMKAKSNPNMEQQKSTTASKGAIKKVSGNQAETTLKRQPKTKSEASGSAKGRDGTKWSSVWRDKSAPNCKAKSIRETGCNAGKQKWTCVAQKTKILSGSSDKCIEVVGMRAARENKVCISSAKKKGCKYGANIWDFASCYVEKSMKLSKDCRKFDSAIRNVYSEKKRRIQ